MPENVQHEWITVEEAADILRVHPDSIRKTLRAQNASPEWASKLGNRWRIRKDALGSIFLGEKVKNVASRPDLFDEDGFRESLRRQGCPESFIGPLISDIKLIVPLLCRNLGEEQIFANVIGSTGELGLGTQDDFWALAIRYLVGWAHEVIDSYKRDKGV